MSNAIEWHLIDLCKGAACVLVAVIIAFLHKEKTRGRKNEND